MQKIYRKLSLSFALLLFFTLIACNNSPQAVGTTTLSAITPSGGTNAGGVQVTLTGRNMFKAITASDYDQALTVRVCGAPLTAINIVGSETTAKAPSGNDVQVIVGTSLTGTTSKVNDPTQKSKDVVLTRPDGTIATLEDAYICNDAPAINTSVAGVLDILQGDVDLDLSTIIVDTDGDPFTVSITGLPASLSYDPDTFKITGTLSNDDVGSSDIVVTIVDSDQKSTSTPMTLTVLDKNDPPVFDNASFTVNEIAQVDAIVGSVLATDVDDLQLNYEIVSGNANNTFKVNAATGRLSIDNRIDHNLNSTFNLQMKVSDPDGLSDSATVTVNVVRDTTVYNWRLSSSWSTTDPIYDIIDGRLRTALIPQLSAQSGGQLNISLVAPSGPNNLNVYSEVSNGTFEMGHTASYLYVNKAANPSYEAANLFFTDQPFGLSEAQHKAWLAAEGQALWDEVNAPHNLIAFRAGTSGDKSIGWFNQPITNPTQLAGLKWRIAGFGAQVATQAGVDVSTPEYLQSVGPLPSALQNGSLQAVRWGGPYQDREVGLDTSGAYYYTGPDWAEQTASIALYINLDKYNALPLRLQTAIQKASSITADTLSNDYASRNAQALATMNANGVQILTQFPPTVLNALRVQADAIQNARAAGDPLHAKVYESWKKFR